MLSNKLTFSLVLVLTLALVAMPISAQDIGVALPAKGEFTVITNSPAGINNGIPITGVTAKDDSDLENLAEILRFGGSIELSILVGDAGVSDFTVTADTEEADIKKLAGSVIISEIMWGLNSSADNQDAAQWVEIYNHNLDNNNSDALQIHFSFSKQIDRVPGTKVTIDDNERVILDQVSTRDSFNVLWSAKGQSGNTAALDDGTPPTDLISMSRNVALDNAGVYKVKTDGNLDGLGNGVEAGGWTASAALNRKNLTGYFVGTPGTYHGSTIAAAAVAKNPGSLSATGVILNEIRNDTSEANLDWIELFYNGDPGTDNFIDIDGYEINLVVSEVDADGMDTGVAAKESMVVDLPAYKLSPGEYFVVYNRMPEDTILAAGVDVASPQLERINKGASHAYSVDSNLDLPNDRKFLLVLRTANDQDNEPDAVKDYAGNGFFTANGKGYDGDHNYNTRIFPLNGWVAPGDVGDFGNNTFTAGAGSWGRVTELNNDGVYRPKSRADNRTHKDDWADYGYMGTGYDRDIDRANAPGTPGYANIAVNVIGDDRDNAADKSAYAFSGTITVSEIMYDAGPRWNLVQWIELYNSSMTETVDLSGWEMEIRNESTDIESYVDASFVFDSVNILPNQTLLLVSGTGANDVDSNRVYNLNQHHRRELGLANRDSRLLSAEGFAINLWAKNNEEGATVLMLADQAGNVDVKGAARIHMWDLPDRGDVRTSIVRQYGSRELDGNGPDNANDGTMESSWKQSDVVGAGLSYYGHRDDLGTPGYRLGGPLPVSLSSFRPVRNQTTGHVDITWVTQSELNNAGFNILRAESKTGAFTVINVKGIIAGHGTTSEKHVYTFTDTTAKPNVVYYYQIEDVSLNGNRTTLRTTHLRGNVSAGGKLTTRWGELKSSGK